MAGQTVAERIGGQPGHSSRVPIIGIVAVLAAIVIVGLAMFVARSGSSSSTSATISPSTSSGQVQTLAVVNSGQQVKTSGGNFTRPEGAVRIGDTLLSGVSVRTLDVRPQESHLKYVAIEVTVQNVGARQQEVGVFRLKDSDGAFAARGSSDAELANQLKGLEGEIVKLWGATLGPGEIIHGVSVFKILRDTKPSELQYTSDARESGSIKLQ